MRDPTWISSVRLDLTRSRSSQATVLWIRSSSYLVGRCWQRCCLQKKLSLLPFQQQRLRRRRRSKTREEKKKERNRRFSMLLWSKKKWGSVCIRGFGYSEILWDGLQRDVTWRWWEGSKLGSGPLFRPNREHVWTKQELPHEGGMRGRCNEGEWILVSRVLPREGPWAVRTKLGIRFL